MPKAEIGSVKDIGKRIKSKGLQKLKFYCQMCQKQCRDQNGFKCHLTSDNHLRQMKIFSDNANGYMDTYSKTFEKLFIDTLRYKHSTVKVNANNVYQEVIRDKHHIHMNSTIWTSLNDFIKYLGKVGKCIVEENANTPGGWYITYIERDATKIHREQQYEQRIQNEHTAEQLYHEKINQQRIEATKTLVDKLDVPIHIQPSNILLNDNDDDTNHNIQINLDQTKVIRKKKNKNKGMKVMPSVFGDDGDDNDDNNDNDNYNDDEIINKNNDNNNNVNNDIDNRNNDIKEIDTKTEKPCDADIDNCSHKKRRDDDEDKTKSSSKKRHKSNDNKTDSDDIDTQPWLYRDIIVRIITKELADGKYYRQKAIIDKVYRDGYTADIILMNDNIKIRIDQDDLETVTPKHNIDNNNNNNAITVRILKGQYRKYKAIVLELNKKTYSATLQIIEKHNHHDNNDTKTSSPIILHHVSYNDFSMIA